MIKNIVRLLKQLSKNELEVLQEYIKRQFAVE